MIHRDGVGLAGSSILRGRSNYKIKKNVGAHYRMYRIHMKSLGLSMRKLRSPRMGIEESLGNQGLSETKAVL